MARRVTPSASRPSSRCSASSRSSRAPGGSCVAARPPAKRSGSCCVARTTCSGYGGTPPSSNQPGRPPPERPPGELPRTTTAAIGQPAEPSPEAPERPGRSMTWRRVLCATAWYQPESTVAQSGGPAVGADRVRPLPVAAVHDVVERAPVGPLDRRERTVGGDAEGDQQGAEPVLGKAQEAPRELLVVDAGMSAADAEVGGGQHDAHRRLAQVELDQVAHLGVVGAWGHERDRGCRAGDVAGGGPHPGKLRELLPVGADDEVPRLLVAGRGCAPRGLQDPVQVLGRDRPLAVGPHGAPGPDRIPRLHPNLLQTRPVLHRSSPVLLLIVARVLWMARPPVRPVLGAEATMAEPAGPITFRCPLAVRST